MDPFHCFYVILDLHIFAGRLSSSENYRNLVTRIELINWLDPLRTSTVNGESSFIRPNLFSKPTARELRAGWAGMGGTRIVNCFNFNQTGFPQLSYSELGK